MTQCAVSSTGHTKPAQNLPLGSFDAAALKVTKVPEDLAIGGLHAEASVSPFLHLYLRQSSEHLAVATVSSRGHVPRHSVDALALGRRVP